MGNLSAAQIMDYAAAAGFAGGDLSTITAIALAESSGNPNAYNPETAAKTPPGKGSYGLWQIYLNVHPEFAGLNLYDPQTNALAAYALYSQAGGFSPWATYSSGNYQQYLQSVPLTLDAATGLPVEDANAALEEAAGMPLEASILPTSINWPAVIVFGALGILALYLLEG